MHIQLIVVGALLVTWLFLTVAANLSLLGKVVFAKIRLGRWFSLVPSWSFFAPNPSNSDYALFYRERFDYGGLSDWREVPFSCRERTLLTTVWNPDSRPKKAVSDAASHILRLMKLNKKADMSLIMSVPYLLILNRISHISRGPGVSGRQFLLVRHSIVEPDPSVVVLSNVHDL